MDEDGMDKPRRRTDWGMISLILALALNLGGGVWWSSRMQSAIENLTTAVTELKQLVREASAVGSENAAANRVQDVILRDHGRRLDVLERDR